MGKGRVWSAEELQQLDDEWGRISVSRIAERHNRSVNAILIKAQRRKLGAHLLGDDRVSVNQIFKAFKVTSYGYLLGRMIKAGLKTSYHRVNGRRFRVVDLDEFWSFMKNNRSMLDFSRLEKNSLGKEPPWVERVRHEDFKRSCFIKPNNTRWTKSEDAELLRLVQRHNYSYSEIAGSLHRTCGAVSRRLHDLGIKDRPIKADNHIKWTAEELKTLCDMIKAGSNYENISRAIGKSPKAIQGKVYSTYLTERLDKVRAMLNGVEWGDNRPDRQLKHKNAMNSGEKHEMNTGISELVCLLTYRANQIAEIENRYGWQHKQCKHWNNGCAAGEPDCDACTHFQRKE